MVNNKNAFWQALVFTLIIFLLGIFLGFSLENSRAAKIEAILSNSEVNLLDEQLRERIIDSFSVGCDVATQSAFEYADKIYSEASNLEKYDSSSKFTDVLKILHKRYDLLRIMLWLESSNLRKECKSDFHTVVYFYDYKVDDVSLRSKQIFFSRLLEDLKNKYSDKILLIPIASNLDLNSVGIVIQNYDIGPRPVILIDDKIKIEEVITLEELEKKVFN